MITAYSRYYRHVLVEDEKSIYDEIVSGLINYKKTIRTKTFLDDSFHRIIFAVKYDNPQFFYIDFANVRLIKHTYFFEFQFVYKYSISEIERMNIAIHKVVETCLSNISSTSSVGKIGAIHDWLIGHSQYGSSGGKKGEEHTAVGALLQSRCVCDGFSSSFKLILDAAKERCIWVVGKAVPSFGAIPEEHAWNIVRINGKNFNVDVTYDIIPFQGFYSKAYFLLSSKELSEDHEIGGILCVPDCKESNNPLHIAHSKKELMLFLKQSANMAKGYSEIRLAKKLKISDVNKLTTEFLNSTAYNRHSAGMHFWYNDRRAILHICWAQKG